MIPKKIHYCWLGDDNIPLVFQKCMATWKEFLPDYEWVLWDQEKFDINSVDFVKEAVSVKKWAFAADYIRLYALYTEGGIYLDMDVIVKKSFNKFLEHDFFTAVESYTPWWQYNKNMIYLHEDGTVTQKISGTALQAAAMGGKAGNTFLKDCIEWYKNKHFILSDGSFFNKILAPDIYATIAQKYGFRYKNEEQTLTNNMKIYPSSVIASNPRYFNKDCFAVHCCTTSWYQETLSRKLIARNKLLRKLFRKHPIIKQEELYDFVQNSPIWRES